MNKRSLDFYFDFMSPYSYLAFQRLSGICSRFSLTLRPRVVDLPSLKLLAGNTGPANVNIPIKIRYLGTDLERWAQKYGVPLIFPKSLKTGAINRAYIKAQEEGVGPVFIQQAFDQVWGRGGDPEDPAMLELLESAVGRDPRSFLAYAASDLAKARLKAETATAHEAGVFGVPTMVVNDQMWWGNDRLSFLENALNQTLVENPKI